MYKTWQANQNKTKTTTESNGYIGPVLGHVQKCDNDKLVNRILTLSSWWLDIPRHSVLENWIVDYWYSAQDGWKVYFKFQTWKSRKNIKMSKTYNKIQTMLSKYRYLYRQMMVLTTTPTLIFYIYVTFNMLFLYNMQLMNNYYIAWKKID